jgi:putative transcriptional regulator
MDDSILESIHKSVKSMHGHGLVDAVTLREFDKLCLPRIKTYTPEQIKKIRERNKSSQAVFAYYLNISPSTIQKWEQGEKKPGGAALKLLNIVDKKGLGILA